LGSSSSSLGDHPIFLIEITSNLMSGFHVHDLSKMQSSKELYMMLVAWMSRSRNFSCAWVRLFSSNTWENLTSTIHHIWGQINLKLHIIQFFHHAKCVP
jgi:hypothetical protein